MNTTEGTPEGDCLPSFVDDQQVLPIPGFVSWESGRTVSAQIREKIAAAMAGDQADNALETAVERHSNA